MAISADIDVLKRIQKEEKDKLLSSMSQDIKELEDEIDRLIGLLHSTTTTRVESTYGIKATHKTFANISIEAGDSQFYVIMDKLHKLGLWDIFIERYKSQGWEYDIYERTPALYKIGFYKEDVSEIRRVKLLTDPPTSAPIIPFIPSPAPIPTPNWFTRLIRRLFGKKTKPVEISVLDKELLEARKELEKAQACLTELEAKRELTGAPYRDPLLLPAATTQTE